MWRVSSRPARARRAVRGRTVHTVRTTRERCDPAASRPGAPGHSRHSPRRCDAVPQSPSCCPPASSPPKVRTLHARTRIAHQRLRRRAEGRARPQRSGGRDPGPCALRTRSVTTARCRHCVDRYSTETVQIAGDRCPARVRRRRSPPRTDCASTANSRRRKTSPVRHRPLRRKCVTIRDPPAS